MCGKESFSVAYSKVLSAAQEKRVKRKAQYALEVHGSGLYSNTLIFGKCFIGIIIITNNLIKSIVAIF